MRWSPRGWDSVDEDADPDEDPLEDPDVAGKEDIYRWTSENGRNRTKGIKIRIEVLAEALVQLYSSWSTIFWESMI